MRIWVLLVVVAMVLCQSGRPAYSAPVGRYGGTLHWGTRNKPTTFNPVFVTNGVTMSLQSLVFNRLVWRSADGTIVPDLARSWNVSADGLVYTFHLRPGVKFSDGTACNAEDVKSTFGLLLDPEVGSPHTHSFDAVSTVTVVDPLTVRIVLKEPQHCFLDRMTWGIVPRRLRDAAADPSSSFGRDPVGAGPFKVGKWDGSFIVLEANPEYYGGRPFLDRIVVIWYDDARALWVGLMRGEVDLALYLGGKDYEILKDDPSFRAYSLPMEAYYALFYDAAGGVFSDVRVRTACHFGIDRKELIERAGNGYGVESSGPFYPGFLPQDSDIPQIRYDPGGAMALLSEAGWNDTNNDGIREKDGVELVLRVLIDMRSDLDRTIAMVVRQHLQRIGIRVVVIPDEGRDTAGGTPEAGSPHAQLRLAHSFSPLAEYSILADWECGGAHPGRAWECSDPQLQRSFAAARAEFDLRKRLQTYIGINRALYREQLASFLYFPCEFHAVSSRFRGTDGVFSLDMPFYKIKDWYLAEGIPNTKGGDVDGGD